MKRGNYALVGLLLVITVPFLLQPSAPEIRQDALQLVIISPHNEAIRYEFSHAFSQWHQHYYGSPVEIDWRTVGGTSQIIRYLDSQYTAAFRQYWTTQKKQPWDMTAANAFLNHRIRLDDVDLDLGVVAVRQGFLESPVSVGIDLLFGGGQYEQHRQAQKGLLVASGYRDTPQAQQTLHTHIPQQIAGEVWFDPDDRWYGAVVSAFGLCYNLDVLAQLPDAPIPRQWSDLGHPALFRQVSLADPTKSGSANKAFEMVIQQAMAEAVVGLTPDTSEFRQALAQGWHDGLNTIRLASANARYYTDSASKVPLDVAAGNAAAGMSIDFYGLFQAAEVARPDGSSRMVYRSPLGGTTVSCDPIGMLRGAPHPELALRFISFVLSLEGQKIWGFKVGAPGGPVKYALHRTPIRRDFFVPEHHLYQTAPDENPYELAEKFQYQSAWTGPLFGIMRVLIRAMCQDPADELRSAWKTIIDCGGPQQCQAAWSVFTALPDDARYENISQTNQTLTDYLAQVRQARAWNQFFRAQYRQARQLALQHQ